MVSGQPDYKKYAAMDFVSQSIGMYMIRDWSVKMAFYKTWYFDQDVAAGGLSYMHSYTVPSDHMLFLNDVMANIQAGGEICYDKVFFAHSDNTVPWTVYSYFNDYQWYRHYAYSRSLPIPGGHTFQWWFDNESSYTVKTNGFIAGYEESPHDPGKTEVLELYVKDMYQKGIFNTCSLQLTSKPKIIMLYNALTGKTYIEKVKIVNGELVIPKGRKHKVKWFRGYKHV